MHFNIDFLQRLPLRNLLGIRKRLWLYENAFVPYDLEVSGPLSGGRKRGWVSSSRAGKGEIKTTWPKYGRLIDPERLILERRGQWKMYPQPKFIFPA